MGIKTRIVIADDHALVRQGIVAFLKMTDTYEVVAEASDGVEAIEAVNKWKPDIVIMDISMPKLGGLEATVEIKKNFPSVKILVLTQYEDMMYIRRFFKAGASGYLVKKAVGVDLLTALEAIMSGKMYVHPSIATCVVDGYLGINKGEPAEDPYDTLTDREKQVLKLIAEGYTQKETADILAISTKTVITHQTNLSEKLNIRTRAGLIKFAIQKGIIKIDS
ncbi:MAG TPA: response regulator transcription factor [Nitrospirota bacterium]|nr:response regulator transcription factor [Nitrospirota bacterium]